MTKGPPFRAVIACGGTGGHLFPGLAVAEALHARGHEVLLFVSEKEIDTLALKARPEFRSEKLPSIGLPSMIVSPAFVRFVRRFWESFSHCGKIYRKFRPSVVLGMGGFTSTAPVLAARMRGLPAFIHESNAIPGRANRLAAKFASKVFLGFEEARQLLPRAQCVVTGTPVRKNLGQPMDRASARKLFHLDPERKTLLVMGGSQGASGINQLLFKSAPLLHGSEIQIIHLTGERDDRLAAANYQRDGIPHYVSPFHHRMEEAYSAADAVLSRAGASSLSEISRFSLPSILIPYPFATDDHQTANARIYVKAGAAEILAEGETGAERLAAMISNLLGDDQRRERMAVAAGGISSGSASNCLAEEMERAVKEAAT
ncbi:MAG: undecaprenyldiphospho-muramoylpentapeptide beta-N-acetylglucosaminyltransferase [Chthoniobacterales bacterium]|nr:undecaprenyldiphospho-muramoylpentapeptide beta-N-acetylglucosaminyltransferase [Chthoniobacterales bacterium]